MKKFRILLIGALVCSRSVAQFPLHTILPMATAADGSVYADTFFNTNSVLKSARVRTIRIFHSNPEAANPNKEITIQVNSAGKFEFSRTCVPPSNITKGFCHSDSIKYDNRGRISENKFVDGKGRVFMRSFVDYLSEGKARWSWIADSTLPSAPPPDTTYIFYNNKGQLIRSEHMHQQFASLNGSVFYNPDGFPDSVQHDKPGIKTYIFRRKKSRNKLTLLLDTPFNEYKWVYNASGKCILIEYVRTNRKNWRSFTYTTRLYYNPDGTLSKVEKGNVGPLITSKYSYAR